MFTGLVEAKGTMCGRIARGLGARLSVECELDALALGESVAVDGVCLTVARITPAGFEAEASDETLSRTTLGEKALGSPVNLERAMPLGGRMGGHIVTGHVDGLGTVVEKVAIGLALSVKFAFPAALARFIAPKGSIGVDGVSLTVNFATATEFDVMLVPHTRDKTSLDAIPAGGHVNLEVDILARYVARMLEVAKAGGGTGGGASGGASGGDDDDAWLARLQRAGYV